MTDRPSGGPIDRPRGGTGHRASEARGSRPVFAITPDARSRAFATLVDAFHDVPWQAPEVVRAYRHPVPPERPDWLERLRALRAPAQPTMATEAVDV